MTNQEHLTEAAIQLFVDGRADDPDVIRRHFESCAMCGRAVLHQERLDRALRTEPLLFAPARVKEAVLREIRVARRFAATTRISSLLSMAFAGAALMGAMGGTYWCVTAWKPSAHEGPFAVAMRQVSAWLAPAMGGVSSFLGSVTSAVLSGQQIAPTLTAIALAIAGVALMDLLVGRRLTRR